jgi:beta-lactamase class D
VKHLTIYIIAFISFFSCSPQKKSDIHFNPAKNSNFTIHNEFRNYFDNCGVSGSIAIFDRNTQQWILSDTTNVMTENLPASTFKIINLLIALETKTINDEYEIVKWRGKTDTLKYGYRPEIYHDMSVKEAFEVSAGWVFIELAKKIGRKNYRKYLMACNYGNLNLSENNDDFWNFGSFAISPINQVEFIRNLYDEKLPFSRRNIEIVKRVMITEETDNFTIRAKTGWTRENNINTGWWVGYLEANSNTYFFATSLRQNRKNNRDDFGTCRKEITKKILNELGFINNPDEKLKDSSSLFSSIDHIPIVVNDLKKVRDIFKNQLHFTVKEGKAHEGIINCFVKFEDGTYLEFIHPIDSLQTIGKYYTNFLKTRQGGTSMAISVTNADLVKKLLNEKGVQFTYSDNKIWQTIEPVKSDLFFIKYAGRNWKEPAKFTAHPNTAISLSATYILTNNLALEEQQYKSWGFTEAKSGVYLETPFKHFTIGKSDLFLLDNTKPRKMNQLLNEKNPDGIYGFEIKVNSMEALKKLIIETDNISYEHNKATIYLKEYHLFLTFTE